MSTSSVFLQFLRTSGASLLSLVCFSWAWELFQFQPGYGSLGNVIEHQTNTGLWCIMHNRVPSVQMGIQECGGPEIRCGELQEGQHSSGHHVEWHRLHAELLGLHHRRRQLPCTRAQEIHRWASRGWPTIRSHPRPWYVPLNHHLSTELHFNPKFSRAYVV